MIAFVLENFPLNTRQVRTKNTSSHSKSIKFNVPMVKEKRNDLTSTECSVKICRFRPLSLPYRHNATQSEYGHLKWATARLCQGLGTNNEMRMELFENKWNNAYTLFTYFSRKFSSVNPGNLVPPLSSLDISQLPRFIQRSSVLVEDFSSARFEIICK